MTKAISVAGLHKSFGTTHALDGLDLEVGAGEVHGFTAIGADVDGAQDRAGRRCDLDRHATAGEATALHVDCQVIALALLGDCGRTEAEAGADRH
jgi:ABC-type histidine transport system ATPase subunit